MRVPAEIRECVAFIGYRDKRTGAPVLKGTGFFLASSLADLGMPDDGAAFFITAQHIVDGIRANGGQPVVRLNIEGGGSAWADVGLDDFWPHPNHPAVEAVDVAVTPVKLHPKFDYRSIPLTMCVNDEVLVKHDIGVGDEVFMPGLFWNHSGKERNLPILRVGNIAAVPEEPVGTRYYGNIEAYLIEARSIGGLSGSPVFAHLGPMRMVNGKVQFAQNTDYGMFFLLGVMQGHWDSAGPTSVDDVPVDDGAGQQELVNMGIGIVTPIQKALDILTGPKAQAHREDIAALRRATIRAELPVED
jgi:hypothetical protein